MSGQSGLNVPARVVLAIRPGAGHVQDPDVGTVRETRWRPWIAAREVVVGSFTNRLNWLDCFILLGFLFSSKHCELIEYMGSV